MLECAHIHNKKSLTTGSVSLPMVNIVAHYLIHNNLFLCSHSVRDDDSLFLLEWDNGIFPILCYSVLYALIFMHILQLNVEALVKSARPYQWSWLCVVVAASLYQHGTRSSLLLGMEFHQTYFQSHAQEIYNEIKIDLGESDIPFLSSGLY